MEQLNFIIKITTNCTLECKYCSYMPFVKENSKSIMSFRTLEAIISQILDLPVHRITFIWHGGEPLIAGIGFFEKIVDLINENNNYNKKIRNNIQTNAMLINSGWIEFLKTNKFNIGFSIDGPQYLHDACRVFSSGKGSYSNVSNGIKLVQNSGMKTGCLAVITKNHIDKAEEMFAYFLRKKIYTYDLLPCLNYDNYGIHGVSITPMEYAQFLVEYFNLWFKYDDPNIKIRVFENIIMGMLGGRVALCKFNGSCDKFLTINNNGDIYPCDKFLGWPEFKFGNILENGISNIIHEKKYKSFSKGISCLNSKCLSCKWLQICSGGCAYFRFMRNGGFSDVSYFCDAYKFIYSHIESCIEKAKTSQQIRI
jgi:uncharacterized protein